MEKKTHYETLGVPTAASQEQIKSAYKKLALQYHPDRNSAPYAEEVFKQINSAYQVLSDPLLRHSYDFALTQPEPTYTYSYAENTSNKPPAPEKIIPFTMSKSLIYGAVFGLFVVLASIALGMKYFMTDFSADYYAKEGKAFFENKDFKNARISFEKSLNNNENNSEVQFFIAQIFAHENDFISATKHLKLAISYAKNPPAEWLKLLGEYGRKAGMFEEAIGAYEQILQQNPNDFVTNLAIGEIYLQDINQFEKAIYYYEKLSKISPSASIGEMGKAIAFLHLKKYEDCKIALDKAQKINPNDPYFYYYYGFYLYEFEQDKEAACLNFKLAYQKGVLEAKDTFAMCL